MSSRNLVGTGLQNGKYVVENELGRGGFGVTYRAVHKTLNQVVVIKTLRWPASDEEDQQLQKFQAEARRLAQCQHPNIVNVTDFFIEAGQPYLVMDFIPGQPLSAIIFPHRPLPETVAIKYTRQIASALQTVHGQGLLHRDVKPQNIMIDRGEAILIDFGIARELASGQTQTHTNLVSEGYAPLEQYLPKARRSAASDVYGLAATLYAAVTGEVPVASVLRSHHPLTPPRQLNPSLSADTEQAILQGMALELAQRPQSMATWLKLLTAPSSQGLQSRSTTQPTQVVAPARPSGYAIDSETFENATAGAPPEQTPPPQSRQQTQQKGPGILSTLFKTVTSLILLGLLTGLGWAGYRLYQTVQQTANTVKEKTAELPDISIPEVSLPEVTLPDLDEILPDRPAPPADSEEPEPDPPPPAAPTPATTPPLVLQNSGDPNTAPPGNGKIVPVPGFAPGTPATSIINRLGEPTRQSVSPSATTTVYELDPNRATIAYIYDAAGTSVQQVEAAFAPSYDRLIMRTALAGMLNGQSTRDIEAGLEQVRTGQIDQFPFEQNGLTGSIKRNNNGFIHIHVR